MLVIGDILAVNLVIVAHIEHEGLVDEVVDGFGSD